ncbi:MAG: M12 family metallo-peptidase [Candidatus Binatia bacterium]
MKVKVLADPSLREKNPGWVEGVRGLIASASNYFEGEFGIRFLIQSVGPWSLREAFSSTALLLIDLKEEFPVKDKDKSYDLIVAFTGEPVDIYFDARARVDRIGNCRGGLGHYVVSSVSAPFRPYGGDPDEAWDRETDVLALIHEFGHIFGAEHSDDSSSIMYKDFAYRTQFDKKNREIVLRNKFCPFER